MTTKEWIQRAKEVHGDRYDYSKSEYINAKTKICIICPEHGEFWQRPRAHISGSICFRCSQKEKSSKRKKTTTEDFIDKSRNIYGNKYDYSNVKYVDAHTKVCIVCPEHGEFWQRPNDHLSGYGCPKCGRIVQSNKRRYSNEIFTQKAKEIHGDKYDYSKVKYINSQTKVCIICPEHGEFWQTPAHHLFGQGCPKCTESFLEETVRIFLEKNNIKYVFQKTFNWLKNNKPMFLDFYLPDYNIAIECQGIQHYKAIEYFGGKEKLKETKERDKLKKLLCEKNNIELIYFNFNDKIISLKNKLL